MKIAFHKLHPEAIIPRIAYAGDLGVDVHCLHAFTLEPQDSTVVNTGLQVHIPPLPEAWQTHFQLGCFVWSKSGLSVKSNIEKGAGVVDPNYTGELMIKLYNHGQEKRHFDAGDKIAQLVFQVCARITEVVEVAAAFDPQNPRGDKGFGSSGKA